MKQSKKIYAIIVVVIVAFFNIITPAFAYNDTSTNGIDFSVQDIPYIDSSNSWSYVYDNAWTLKQVSTSTRISVFSRTDNANVFLFAYPANDPYIVYVSDVLDTDVRIAQTQSGYNGYPSYTTQAVTSTLDNNTNLYYNTITSGIGRSYNIDTIPTFNTFSDGINAVKDWLDNPSGGSSPQSLSISLPAGNILVADISGTSTNHYYLETTGGTTGATAKPGLNNIQVGYYDTLPSTFQLPSSSLSYPPYWSGAGKQSIFGTYNRQAYSSSLDTSHHYFVVGNPMYPNDNNASANRLNSDLYIQIDLVNSYRIIDLNTSYVNGTLTGTNDGSTFIDGTYDSDTGEWNSVNQDGVSATPVWGGQNDFINTPTTILDYLENIASSISSFFTGAIGAVTTLVSAGSAFFTTLAGLYGWLPVSVLSVLSAALIIVITIGVIKVFI